MVQFSSIANAEAVDVQRDRLDLMVERREITRDDGDRIKICIRAYAEAHNRCHAGVFNLNLVTLVNDALNAIQTMNPYGFS